MNLLHKRDPAPPRRRTVLLVDDDFANIRRLRRTFEAAGWNVVLTTNSGQALELHRQLGFDAFLIDLAAPETDPFDLVQNLRAARAHQPTPTILMTSAPTRDAEEATARLEAVELLRKPVDGARLAGVMRRLAGSPP
jgi:CheY-like chemotaxis protein